MGVWQQFMLCPLSLALNASACYADMSPEPGDGVHGHLWRLSCTLINTDAPLALSPFLRASPSQVRRHGEKRFQTPPTLLAIL